MGSIKLTNICPQMFAVRTTLTDILLEVTNEEIRNIATESLSKVRLKGMILYKDKQTHIASGKLRHM